MSEGESSGSVRMEAGEGSSSRGNVSVTPINMSTSQTNNGQFSYSSSSVRISVPSRELRSADEDDSTDAEVSNIDFTQHHYQVNMRSKQRASSSAARCDVPPERPMSWEGELSDTEMPVDATSIAAKSRAESGAGVVADAEIACASAAPFRDDQRVPPPGPPPAHLHLHHRSLSMNRIAVLSEGIRNVPVGIAPQLTARRDPPPQTILPEVKCEVGSPVRAPRGLSTASTDSAIHSMYTHSVYSSPSASPSASRHFTPSLSRNNSDASHSSCYSYSSEFSPTHSPVQSRHMGLGMGSGVAGAGAGGGWRDVRREGEDEDAEGDDKPAAAHGVSRQQLINSPCPICGDKISGFHYGIFSCESCKGFFKRTVQNRKNYVCLRGANCPVGVTTRKKCPACRFDKCLHCGMKLEAIREDRTRGGRSTYQCAYSLAAASPLMPHALRHASSLNSVSTTSAGSSSEPPRAPDRLVIPQLLQEIMDVEHLWQYSESELSRMQRGPPSDLLNDLCNIADHRLYKIVKWCKSLPLFKNISIDDQICLLINSWCELLVLSCCYRGVGSPGEVRVGNGRTITLHQSTKLGLTPCIERMLAFTDHLRRLRVDRYEYVALKVIVLLTSDASELREPEKVRASQERALAALQAYTAAHHPGAPAKFGELLLRIPDLQRTCQVGKEMLNPSNKTKDGESFNLLMELLRGDH